MRTMTVTIYHDHIGDDGVLQVSPDGMMWTFIMTKTFLQLELLGNGKYKAVTVPRMEL